VTKLKTKKRTKEKVVKKILVIVAVGSQSFNEESDKLASE
jgi:hypothetical protein